MLFLPAGKPSELAIEIENIVDLTTNFRNVELAMTLQTDIENDDAAFYTDSNCLQVGIGFA